MRLIKNSFLCKILRVNGITLYPFVFVRDKAPSQLLLNHEMIHLEQVRRLGLWKFYTSYLMEYFKNRAAGMGHYQAYLEISYEKEAREHQENPERFLRC